MHTRRHADVIDDTPRVLDYFGRPVTAAAPANRSRFVAFLDFLIKISPPMTLIGALFVYMSSTRQQNKFALETAKQQVERSSIENPLDIGKKAALGVSTQPRLGIDLLPSDHAGAGSARYLIVWEVGIVNQGNRTIKVENSEAELYVGSERNPTPKPPAIFEFNHPRPDWVDRPPAHPAIEWHRQQQSTLRRDFSPRDLYGAAIGGMSPGDRRVSEISGIVSGRPGMWIFAVARINIRAESDTSEQVEWAYDLLPRRNAEKPAKNSESAVSASR